MLLVVFVCLLITSITTVHICSMSLFQLQLLSILMFALPLQLFMFVLCRYFHNSYFQYLNLLITSITSVNISSISLFSLQSLSKLIFVRYFHYKCYFRYNYCQYLFLLITSVATVQICSMSLFPLQLLSIYILTLYFRYNCQYLFLPVTSIVPNLLPTF